MGSERAAGRSRTRQSFREGIRAPRPGRRHMKQRAYIATIYEASPDAGVAGRQSALTAWRLPPPLQPHGSSGSPPATT